MASIEADIEDVLAKASDEYGFVTLMSLTSLIRDRLPGAVVPGAFLT